MTSPTSRTTCSRPIGHVAVLGALLAALFAAPARAEDAKDRARVLYREAIAKLSDKNYEACYVKITEAWKLAPNAFIAGLRADCAFGLKRYPEAAEMAQSYLDQADAKAKPEDRDNMHRVLDAAKKQIAIVRLVVVPAGAEVLVDGNATDARKLYRAPGDIDVRASAPGHEPRTVTRSLAAGQEVELVLDLPRPAEKQPKRESGGGGALLGAGAAGLGLGLVAVGVGAGLQAARNDKVGEAAGYQAQLGSDSACFGEPKPAACAPLRAAVKDADTFHNVSIPLFVAGGLVAAGSVALLVVGVRARPSRPAGFVVSPQLGPGVAGIVVGGSLR